MTSVGKIGVLMPEIFDVLDYELLSGIQCKANQLGYDIVVYTGIFNSQPELQQDLYTQGLENIYSLICKNNLDGIIFVAERFHNENVKNSILGYLSQTNIPNLVLGCEYDGFETFYACEYVGAYKITRHLIDEHNSKKIFCIAGVPEHKPSIERLQGYKDALKDCGIEADDKNIFYGWYWKDVPVQIANQIADGELEHPDAVVCLSDIMAISLYDELEKHGITDIAVTGYDGIWNSIIHDPQITTVTGRDRQFGESAMCRLFEKITGEKCSFTPSEQYIRFGRTCGCGFDKIGTDRSFADALETYIRMTLMRNIDKKTFIATDYISPLANAESIENLMDETNKVGHILRGWKWIDLCICDDWQVDNDNPEIYRQHSFSDNMYLGISKRYGTNEKDGYFFPVKDIIPALINEHEPCLTVITSLHCKGQIFGYCALTYDNAEDIDLSETYMKWCDAVSSGLKTLRKKLYIEFTHQQAEKLLTTDPVTGMMNKRGFLSELKKSEISTKILMISVIREKENSAFDSSIILANALKTLSELSLSARVTDKIFAAVIPDDYKTADEYTFIIQQKMKDILRNSENIPDITSEIYSLESADKFDIIQKSFSEVCMSAEMYYEGYREQIFKLRHDIMANPHRDWNIPDIVSEIAISRTHLQRLYKEFFSTSIKDDIILSRMNRAKQLLAHTDIRISEIAEQCGYNNENHFMRQFKEKNGITALNFRKNSFSQ